MLSKLAKSQFFANNLFNKVSSKFHTSSMLKKEISVRDALNSAMVEEMERDEKVFLMGEEVGLYQGAYKVSKGLIDKFGPKRVWDTPITEMGFAGIGAGSAMYGLRPIVEFMTWNFALQAIDHIVNSAAKIRYMSAGDISCPIVFRGPNGAAAAVGAQHSQDFSAWYSSLPGIKVIAVFDAEDARGLLKAAIRDPNPIVFLENELMYNDVFNVSDSVMDKDFILPIGKAKIMKEGKHVTIVSFGHGVKKCLAAAAALEKEGISAEVINLRTIRPLDRQTIVDSVKKTSRIVTVEEGFPQCGVGSEIAALLMESSAFDYLDAPLERVTGLDIPLPYAPNLEAMSLPQIDSIVTAARKTLTGAKNLRA